MTRERELTIPREDAALGAFMCFAGRLVEAFAFRAPGGELHDAVELAGRAFAGESAAWPALVRTVAVLLAFSADRNGASGELRAFVSENADLLYSDPL
jgi:hypothetical protein